jgi:hypothetical protein
MSLRVLHTARNTGLSDFVAQEFRYNPRAGPSYATSRNPWNDAPACSFVG